MGLLILRIVFPMCLLQTRTPKLNCCNLDMSHSKVLLEYPHCSTELPRLLVSKEGTSNEVGTRTWLPVVFALVRGPTNPSSLWEVSGRFAQSQSEDWAGTFVSYAVMPWVFHTWECLAHSLSQCLRFRVSRLFSQVGGWQPRARTKWSRHRVRAPGCGGVALGGSLCWLHPAPRVAGGGCSLARTRSLRENIAR